MTEKTKEEIIVEQGKIYQALAVASSIEQVKYLQGKLYSLSWVLGKTRDGLD